MERERDGEEERREGEEERRDGEEALRRKRRGGRGEEERGKERGRGSERENPGHESGSCPKMPPKNPPRPGVTHRRNDVRTRVYLRRRRVARATLPDPEPQMASSASTRGRGAGGGGPDCLTFRAAAPPRRSRAHHRAGRICGRLGRENCVNKACGAKVPYPLLMRPSDKAIIKITFIVPSTGSLYLPLAIWLFIRALRVGFWT